MVSTIQASPLFEKYTIDTTYTVRRTNPDGSITIIDDPKERGKLLDSNFFQGSIAVTQDDMHVSLIHKIIYLSQKIHAWFSGRKIEADHLNACHGMVILGKGKPGEKKPHPFLIAHAYAGVQTSNNDYLREKDTTRLLIFRPVDSKVREIYKKNAEKTAFVDRKEQRTALSPKEKHKNSPCDMVWSVVHNQKHAVCLKHGPIADRIKKRTASLLADCLLDNQPMNDKGKLRSFFCIPYAFSLLQQSVLMASIDDLGDDIKSNYLHNSQGQDLKRSQLIEKIMRAFEKKDTSDRIAERLWNVYSSQKLVRMDSEFIMSSYAVKKLNKLSIIPVLGNNATK